MEANQWPQLVKVDGDKKIEINTSPYSIGRGLNCNTVITSKVVSRVHCIFTKTDDGWIVTDKSTNGIIVNGKVLKGASSGILKDNDLIILTAEPYAYRFHPPPPPQPEPQQPPPALEELATTKRESEDDSATTKKRKSSDQDNAEPATELKTEESKQSYMDIIEDEFTCSICSELFIKAVTLNCSHSFCKYCIKRWQKKKSTCPICRAEIVNIIPTQACDNIIANVLEKAPDEVKERRKKMIADRAEDEETNVASRSGNTNNNRNNGTRHTDSTATIVHSNEPVIIELSDNETDDDDQDDDSSYFDDESESEAEVDDWEDESFTENWFQFRPSGYSSRNCAVYGGYGACYTCGERGHWANGCPNRRNRRN